MVDQEISSNRQNNDIKEEEEKVSVPQLVYDFDPERRKLAILYTRAVRKFDFQTGIISLIIMIFIIFSRITVGLEEYVVNNISDNQFIVVGVFFLIAYVVLSIFEFPIVFYSFRNFSRKYGLVKLSDKQWFKRHVKGEIFGLILGMIVFEGFYLFLRIFPDS